MTLMMNAGNVSFWYGPGVDYMMCRVSRLVARSDLAGHPKPGLALPSLPTSNLEWVVNSQDGCTGHEEPEDVEFYVFRSRWGWFLAKRYGRAEGSRADDE
jgi:hypothetical protein